MPPKASQGTGQGRAGPPRATQDSPSTLNPTTAQLHKAQSTGHRAQGSASQGFPGLPRAQGRAGPPRATQGSPSPSQAATTEGMNRMNKGRNSSYSCKFPGANIRHPDFCAKIRVFFGPCGELAFFLLRYKTFLNIKK